MNPRLAVLACVIVGTFVAGANLAWQHVQHQEQLPDGRTGPHDLRTLRLQHLDGAGFRWQRAIGGAAAGKADEGRGVSSESGLAVPRDYDARDPRRLTYHVVISSGEGRSALPSLRMARRSGSRQRCMLLPPLRGDTDTITGPWPPHCFRTALHVCSTSEHLRLTAAQPLPVA